MFKKNSREKNASVRMAKRRKMAKNLMAGFTLYEIMISLAITTILAGIVLYDHKKFDTDIEISDLGYQIALDFRQAQVNSISVSQSFNSAGQAVFDAPYGL